MCLFQDLNVGFLYFPSLKAAVNCTYFAFRMLKSS